ncbi:MAG: oligosaccharide flippase family protein [Anaerolineae bacterium]|nr:oligosaccharide flippase family protein [Anaerolineae bacterium]
MLIRRFTVALLYFQPMRRLFAWAVPARRLLLREGLVPLALLVILLVLFGPVTLGGRSLVPFDALYQFAPWSSFAAQQGVGAPHNALVTDLLLQNYSWKAFIVQQLQAGQVPLWNPYLFAGVPFLAAGQHSALYPLSVLYYILPLWLAFGWFTVIQIWLAGLGTYAYARTLGLGRGAAGMAAFTFALGQLFLVNPVHPMILAGMSWLPVILLALEQLMRRLVRGDGLSLGVTLSASLAAVAMALVFLAGHIEIALYTLLVAGFYALWRLVSLTREARRAQSKDRNVTASPSPLSVSSVPQGGFALSPWLKRIIEHGVVLVGVVMLGVGLAAVQTVPLYELVSRNFREGGTSLAEVYQYAFPPRHILAFIMPDVYGNPSHHGYYDIIAGRWTADLRNRQGEPVADLAWGIKNYVEGAVYAGLLPLLLAGVALWSAMRRPKTKDHGPTVSPITDPPSSAQPPCGTTHTIPLFATLAVLSLAFAFGTPLYALLYALPGFSQLHTPFRWVFPYAFSLAMLAGLGWSAVARHPVFGRRLGWLAALAGGLTLVGVAVGYVMRLRLVPLADRLVDRLARAGEVFSGGAAFLSYEGRTLLLCAVFLTLSGLALILLARDDSTKEAVGKRRKPAFLVFLVGSLLPTHPLPTIFALAVLALDLFAASWGFNPAVDPRLGDFTPPAVAWLQQRRAEEGPFRLTVLGDKGILPPNLAMLYGLEDARGYDSIIPRQYVDFARLIDDQDLLLYNQVAPLHHNESLESPLLDLLGVRYVLTTRRLDRPGWTLAYDGEIKIYRNEDAAPRAYFATDILNQAELDAAAVQRLSASPSTRLLAALSVDQNQAIPFSSAVAPSDAVTLTRYTPSTLELDVQRADQPGLLVINDSYFPGWQAFIRPQDPHPNSLPEGERSRVPSPSGRGAGGEGLEQGGEVSVPIIRATGAFRALSIPPGDWHVRLTYSPMSIKVGLYLSFLAAALLAFLVGFALWRRVYGPGHETDTVRRVARNSLAPMLTTLGNKVVDFAFAALMLRLLGPMLSGRYYFAVAVVGYLEIWSNFGLNLYLTRQVAQHRDTARDTLAQTLTLRLVLLGLAVPVLMLVGFAWRGLFGLSDDTALAIVLLVVALVPGNVAAALSSVFYAYERMEYPAGLTSLTTLVKVALGALALLLGWGFVGLALVAIVSNLITVGILWRAASRLFFRPRFAPALAGLGGIALASYPLMLNHLLQTLFFKVDVTLLQPLQGDIVVGWYSTAYKWIDALLIIPAYFTLAIFPLMSRYATEDGGRQTADRRPQTKGEDQKDARSRPSSVHRPPSPLARTYLLAVRLLLYIALPVAMATTFMAEDLVRLLGGAEYLPHGAIALRIMIWFLPFSFVNGVTQYVLVAVDQARWITRSFALAFSFNLIFNLLFIPRYGYPAAAVITILSELVLMVPFLWAVHRHVTPLNPLALAWRPALASMALGGVIAWLWGRAPWPFVLLLAALTYLAVLVAVGGVTQEDRQLARRLLPKSVHPEPQSVKG